MQLICITSLTFSAEGKTVFELTLILIKGHCVNCGFTPVICLLSTCSAPMDTNLLSNIHKLFSERIDIFSSVEFNKVSAGLGDATLL